MESQDPIGYWGEPFTYGGGVDSYAGAQHVNEGFWRGDLTTTSEEKIFCMYYVPE